MKHHKQSEAKLRKRSIARDFPCGNTSSVKGRPAQDTSRYQAPTRGTGKRWGNGISPSLYTPTVWGYTLPDGRVIYATTKGKGPWFRVA